MNLGQNADKRFTRLRMTSDHVPSVQRQFGRAAADYASSDVHAKGESLSRLVELSAPQSHWRALDVATGAGHMAAAFAPWIADIIASDVTPEMLAEAQKLAEARGLTNLSVCTAEAKALPFADGTFDLVCCRLAAHHFADLAAFVMEVKRVLKAGGTFALVDNVAPDASTLGCFTAAEVETAAQDYNAFEKLRDPSHGFAPMPGVWINLVTAAGFTVSAHEQMTKEIDFASWVKRMRCAPQTVALLERLLTTGPDALRAFLRPRRDAAGALYFSLQELLLVARNAT
jgi:ubiquinone/menaquinone biosynthesis C-methylase UbiE